MPEGGIYITSHSRVRNAATERQDEIQKSGPYADLFICVLIRDFTGVSVTSVFICFILILLIHTFIKVRLYEKKISDEKWK